jgi:hypothetical protein
MLGQICREVVLPLQILACCRLFRMSYKMSDSLARATGAVYRRAWRQVIYAALVLAGTYVGQFWGLPGVAVGVAIALIVNFLLMAHLSLQLTNLRTGDMVKAHKPGLLFGLITGLVSHLMVTLCRTNNVPDLMTILITGSGVGITLLLTFICFPGLISVELKGMYEKLVTGRFKNLFPKNA